MKIGIITMHRVQNYGSILQAYALQKQLNKLGYKSEIIDYIYPNSLHRRKKTTLKSWIEKCISKTINLFTGNPQQRKRTRFNDFLKNHIQLSTETFSTKEELDNNRLSYDLYISGSDQVWNPTFVSKDPSFMCSFVSDDSPRISYSSSFTVNSIPRELTQQYRNYLNRYKGISVREFSGINIIRELINKDASLACDPTLLLEKKDWLNLSKKVQKHISQPYILVYLVTYSINPYPQADYLIARIQKQMGLKVVYLNGSKREILKPNSTIIKDAGPLEFIQLIKNASFVITTSFHGTAFSIMLGVPFLSIIKSINQNDNRILSLLEHINATNHLYTLDDNHLDESAFTISSDLEDNLANFREQSINYLKNTIVQSYA